MEETRREIVEAEEVITNGKTETIRHRAIIKEERAEDGQLCVSICELYEDCDGQYTEDGEIRQNNDAGSRWKGSTPPHGWRSWPEFERTVTHYGGLKEKPDGWWPSLPTRRVYTVDGLFEVLAVIAQSYVETLKEAGFPRAYVDGRLEGQVGSLGVGWTSLTKGSSSARRLLQSSSALPRGETSIARLRKL